MATTQSKLQFKAIPHAKLELALSVRSHVYVNELGYAPTDILNDSYDARASHFVALSGGSTPIAAMRILTTRPFEFESFVQVSQLNRTDGLPAEISRLCVIPQFRTVSRGQFVHAGMWALALAYAESRRIDEYWIWSEPGMEPIYKFLGFAPVPDLTFVHALFGKRYQVMRLCLQNAKRKLPEKRSPARSIRQRGAM